MQFTTGILVALLLHLIPGSHGSGRHHHHHHDARNRQLRSRIIGGDESDPQEFPYYVELDGCGGSLIAPDVVLSAAHCGDYDYVGDSIVVGAVRPGETSFGATRVKVIEQISHPNFDNFSTANDAMVLRISPPVSLSSSVQLVLNDEYAIPSNGEDLTVIGLGDLFENGPAPTTLMDVAVQAIDTDRCNGADAYDGDVIDSVMLCAGVQGGGKNSCFGDSGGPIVKRINNKHVQVGIDSWANGCGEAKYPGVYTRVSGVYNWITSVVCDRWQSDGPLCGGGDSSNNGNNNTGGGGNNGSSGTGDGDVPGGDDDGDDKLPADDDDGDNSGPNSGDNNVGNGSAGDDDISGIPDIPGGNDDGDDDGPNAGDDDAQGKDDDDDGYDDDDGPNAGDDDAQGKDDDDDGYDDGDGPNDGDDDAQGKDDDGYDDDRWW